MRRELRAGEVLTVAQLAEYLQLHKLTVYKYIREGKIPAVRIGRIIRIRAEDVGVFLLTQQVQGSRAAGRRAPATPAARRISGPEHAEPVGPQVEEIQVGPQQPEGATPRDAVVTGNPVDWVIRGLH